MALAVVARFDFLDDKGKTSFTKVRVPTTFSLAQYGEFGTAFGQLLANVSNCKITGGSFTFALDLSGLGLRTVASVAADVAEKGAFIFNTAVTGLKARMRIPTFNETLIPSGSDAIDLVQADVAVFQAAMENGIVVPTAITVQPTDDRTNDITGLTVAKEVKRRTLT